MSVEDECMFCEDNQSWALDAEAECDELREQLRQQEELVRELEFELARVTGERDEARISGGAVYKGEK